jgi:hypothetical protein
VDDNDTRLTHQFVRDLDEIPLPPRGAWRRAPRGENTIMRASRMLLTAGAVVAILALALVVGLQLNERQQSVVVASPSPTASQATSGPSSTPTGTACPSSSCGVTGSASPAASGGYNDDFGFVLTASGQGTATTVRRESGDRVGSFDQSHLAISPDGRQVAWFTPNGPQQQLLVASASDVTRIVFSSTLPANERGGTIVWASDGSGLLYQLYTVEAAPTSPTTGNPALYSIRRIDLRAGAASQVVLTTPTRGLVLEPIAWDRAGNVAAVVETGEGGFMGAYDAIRFNGADAVTTRTPVVTTGGQYLAFSVRASSDAKLVLGAAIGNGASGLEWWPIADFAAHRSIAGGPNGLWRPGTHEIATTGTCAGDPACGPNGGVRLLDVDKGTSRIVYGLRSANMSLRTFRADGSAVVVSAPQAPGANQYDYTLVPLTGSGSPVTFTDANGLLASVRIR